jgi:DNA polymerase-3 subunit gamma/tau
LEEPPEDVIFILATTDPEKLPQTVLSRCMRLDFKRVPEATIMQNMKNICTAHGVEITDDALRLLATNADGSVRDSLSLLEQCLSSGDKLLDRDTVLELPGGGAGGILHRADREGGHP